MHRIRRGLAVAVAGALAACGQAARQADNGIANAETAVHVRNDNFSDVTVYLLDGGRRVRLGTVAGLSSGTLRFPPHVVPGLREVRFLIDPIGGRRTWTSEAILVTPGDIVELTVPTR